MNRKFKLGCYMVAHKVGKKRSWNLSIWVPKDVITNMKGPQIVWVPKETWSSRMTSGDLEAWLTRRWKIQAKKAKLASWTCVAQVPQVMIARFQFKLSCSSFALARLFALHCLVLYLVSCLCHDLTHEQPIWFDKCVESYTKSPFMVHELHEVCISFVYHEHKL